MTQITDSLNSLIKRRDKLQVQIKHAEFQVKSLGAQITAVNKEIETAQGLPINTDFTYSKPSGFILQGREFALTDHKWKELLITVCKFLYKQDKKKFESLFDRGSFRYRADSQWRREVDGSPGTMRSPSEVAKGVWVETNFNANRICKIIEKMLKEFGIEETEFKVKVKFKESIKVTAA